MNNQKEENLELYSYEELEKLIKNIHDEIKQMEQKIVPIKSEQMKRKLIELLNLSNEDLNNISNFELVSESLWNRFLIMIRPGARITK